MRLVKVVSGLMLLLPSIAFSQNVEVPNHNCQKPTKPAEYKSFSEFGEFNEEFIRYQKCMNNFIKEHKQAMELHHQAATMAVKEWNQFLNKNLN